MDIGQAVSQWLAERNQPVSVKSKTGERRQLEIGIGSQILRDLGVSEMTLLSNAPASVYVGLEGYGLKIVGVRKIS